MAEQRAVTRTITIPEGRFIATRVGKPVFHSNGRFRNKGDWASEWEVRRADDPSGAVIGRVEYMRHSVQHYGTGRANGPVWPVAHWCWWAVSRGGHSRTLTDAVRILAHETGR